MLLGTAGNLTLAAVTIIAGLFVGGMYEGVNDIKKGISPTAAGITYMFMNPITAKGYQFALVSSPAFQKQHNRI